MRTERLLEKLFNFQSQIEENKDLFLPETIEVFSSLMANMVYQIKVKAKYAEQRKEF